jgi:hypothetical protein
MDLVGIARSRLGSDNRQDRKLELVWEHVVGSVVELWSFRGNQVLRFEVRGSTVLRIEISTDKVFRDNICGSVGHKIVTLNAVINFLCNLNFFRPLLLLRKLSLMVWIIASRYSFLFCSMRSAVSSTVMSAL